MLTEEQRVILDCEKKSWSLSGAKESYIAETLGMKPIRYYQILNQLLDNASALAAEPVLVNRLRRLRDERLGARRR